MVKSMKYLNMKPQILIYPVILGLSLAIPNFINSPSYYDSNLVQAQTAPNRQPMTVRSDIQEANSDTGVITARGNVYINYPARNIQATASQAQFFSRENRLVLSGNVYVLQDGNTMRAEVMTYLIEEGRFIATPETKQQVESVYLIDQENNTNR